MTKLTLFQKALEASKTCDHPADRRQQIGFGIFCDKCKIRLALNPPTVEDFTESILDAVKNGRLF